MSQSLLKKDILDARSLLSWMGNPRRSPLQLNGVYGADAEIIQISKYSYLAISVDQLSEEIRHGLFRSPEVIGRIAIESALSDLAAAGVKPLGVVVGTQWKEACAETFKRDTYRAMEKSLRAHHAYLLGGDTSSASETSFSVTAIGHASRAPLQRIGARPGDVIVTTGRYGMGPALGFQMFEKTRCFDEAAFRPSARLKEGEILRNFAHCAMDTSDGFAATLATLGAINSVGFCIDESRIPYAPRALAFTRKAHLPRTSLLFGEVGDFEIIAAVSPRKLRALTRALPEVQPIGITVKNPAKSSINVGKRRVPIQWALNQKKEKDTIKSLYKVYQEMLDTLRALQLP